MAAFDHTLEIEGWRSVPHSYAIVNQFQCLQILRRPEIRLLHKDVAYFSPNWRSVGGLFDASAESAIGAIPPAATGERPDALLRITYPYNYSRSLAKRTCVFGTAEYGCVPRKNFVGSSSLAQVMRETDFTLVTPSHWSRQGFLRSGADPDRVVVIPHGIDPALYHPISGEQRAALRTQLGWNGFVFLTLGAMTPNKGLGQLLKAFALVAQRQPEARLVLKGLKALYPSLKMLEHECAALTPAEVKIVQPRLIWLEHTLSFADMARLYQAADAYVSPYFAEGFNLPALEAAACGTLVICTRGGPTDDFTTPDFALRIDSEVRPVESEAEGPRIFLHPNGEHLAHLMGEAIQRDELRSRARAAGPAFTQSRFTWKHAVDQLLEVMFPERQPDFRLHGTPSAGGFELDDLAADSSLATKNAHFA